MKSVTCYRGVAQSWLCDANRHLNTQNYVGALDCAMQHFFGILGHFPERGTGWVDLQQNISYRMEIAEGELFEVRAQLTGTGRSSIRYIMDVIQSPTREIAATAECVSVLFDRVNRKSIEVPDCIKRALVDETE